MKHQSAKHPLVAREEEVQKQWHDNQIFAKTVAKDAPQGDYVFYDGPPFATGLPHYGHLVGSAMKDAVPRYWTMRGYRVERRWGWDCHGLPIENIVEKELGFKSKKDIEQLGIATFNEKCRSKVLEYATEWRTVIDRFGRWADMDKPYQTMDLAYMESVWWVFKQLWDKDLIYEGYKSMHICPRCETTLSQQEVSEGYKDIKDLSVIVKFELVDEPGTFVLAWTTTPWTLPANVALAVGGKIEYVEAVEVEASDAQNGEYSVVGNEKLILAKERIISEENRLLPGHELYLFNGKALRITGERKSKDLIGRKYRSLFPYYENSDLKNKENIYTIVYADFVTTEDGTGVVHVAPAFGEDDMKLGQQQNLPFIQNVTMSGQFTDEVTDFPGQSVKPIDDHQATDVDIIKYLASKGLLFAKEKIEHSYPHCWRCDTPLLNYATSSWFVAVSKIKDRAIKEARHISWSPEHIKDGRFGKWLEGARDWSISRQRFWASVMPVWRCECGELRVFGSVAELEEASGQTITDLHKHIVDEVTAPCAKCDATMHRIPDVLDTWFDSGSMPYAQLHYPFENEAKLTANFPAEFIAEGVDQTRAWFYYLHLLGVALLHKPAFKHVIVNGIVLAEDGKKMAKKLKNYPDPTEVMERYGADALRYYLLSSPVVGAENLNFSEAGVKEAFQKVVMLTSNIVSFYKLYAHEGATVVTSDYALDRWIMAKLHRLIGDVTENMDRYDLARASRPIQEFIDELSTWWLRRSRDRFKGDERDAALVTLREVLLTLAKVMAPFTPFIAESVYHDVGGELESVHLESWPEADKKIIDEKLFETMTRARQIVELGLASRAEHGIKIRQPLSVIEVMGSEPLGDEIDQMICDEVNVKSIVFAASDELRVTLNTELTPALRQEGMVRELIRLVNERRKQEGLTIADTISVTWQSESADVQALFATETLVAELLSATIASTYTQADNDGVAYDLNGAPIQLVIQK